MSARLLGLAYAIWAIFAHYRSRHDRVGMAKPIAVGTAASGQKASQNKALPVKLSSEIRRPQSAIKNCMYYC
jgi:hypothetical protein